MADSLSRSALFSVMAAIVKTLPFASDTGKHNFAATFFKTINADVVLAQDSRGLGEHKGISEEFHPPFIGNDEYTAVLVRKSLCEQKSATNVSAEVREPLLEKLRGRSGAGRGERPARPTGAAS